MTNKELAEKLDNWLVAEPGVFAEAARRLRSLPDPEPAKDLRWLVGRHECLSRELKLESEQMGDKWPWRWLDSFITESAALTVVRGIVKSMCDEHGGSWFPTGQDVYPQPDNRWYYYWIGQCHHDYKTELDALDALLTAMGEK